MNFKLLLVIPATLIITGCQTSGSKKASEQVSYTVDFTKLDLSNDDNVIQSGSANFNSRLLSYINNSISDLTLDFSSSAENTVKVEKSDFPTGFDNEQGLIIGSKSSDGWVELNFSKKLIELSLQIKQYYNIYVGYDFGQPQNEIYYDCQEYDENNEAYVGYSKIVVNNDVWRGSGKTYRYNETYTSMYIDIPEENTANFTVNSNAVVLKSLEGSERCRIYQMTFTFEK